MDARKTAAVVTVSDGVAHGTREDASGAEAEDLLRAAGFDVATRTVVADERPEIEGALRSLAAGHALIVTTGGTGFGPRDVTPEATRAVLDRWALGIAEAIRADAVAKTPHGMLSRGIAGIRGRTLVVNLPGSPGGCRDGFAVLRPALGHAVQLITGEETAHRQT
jgi:molybdopterin adenylyltransferase